MAIDYFLRLAPECVDIFIEMFEKEGDGSIWNEDLARIILKVNHYQPAINYLMSLGETDFTGYAGFPEQ